jgi:translation initiation factor IF-2
MENTDRTRNQGGQGQGNKPGQGGGQQQGGREGQSGGQQQGGREGQGGSRQPGRPTPSGVPNEGRGTGNQDGGPQQGARQGGTSEDDAREFDDEDESSIGSGKDQGRNNQLQNPK